MRVVSGSGARVPGPLMNSPVAVTAAPAAQAARLWVAHADSRYFRSACWEPVPMRGDGASWLGQVRRPARGHVALFGELGFTIDGFPYHLSTQIRQSDPEPSPC